MVATILCETGRTAQGRAAFEELLTGGLTDLPHDWGTLAIPALAAQVCAHLDDAPRARTLHALLEPHAGQFVDMGPSWLGSTSYYLGLLAQTLECFDEADARFATAAEAHRAIGAPAWLARTQLDWAFLLLRRRSAGDASAAAVLLGEALDSARELGLGTVERRAAQLHESIRE